MFLVNVCEIQVDVFGCGGGGCDCGGDIGGGVGVSGVVVEWTVSLRINATTNEFSFNMCIPIVLDFVIRSSR